MSNQSSKRHSAVTLACFAALSALVFGVVFEPGQSEAAPRGVIAEPNQLRPLVSLAETDS